MPSIDKNNFYREAYNTLTYAQNAVISSVDLATLDHRQSVSHRCPLSS